MLGAFGTFAIYTHVTKSSGQVLTSAKIKFEHKKPGDKMRTMKMVLECSIISPFLTIKVIEIKILPDTINDLTS